MSGTFILLASAANTCWCQLIEWMSSNDGADKAGLSCARVWCFSPACLWFGCAFGPWWLLPCWRKRAAPFTMKKLSLRLQKQREGVRDHTRTRWGARSAPSCATCSGRTARYLFWTGYERRLQLTAADYLGKKKKTAEGDAFSAAAGNGGLNA